MKRIIISLISNFLLWLKRIFHICQVPEGISLEPSSKKNEVKLSAGKSSELSIKPIKEKILTTELLQESEEEKIKTKKRKPQKKKAPIEESKKEPESPLEEERGSDVPKQGKKIDLGNIQRKKPRRAKQPPQPAEGSVERIKKGTYEKETLMRVESPYVEIDMDQAKVFLIIPKQQFKTHIVNDIPQQLHYKLVLDGTEQTISTRTSSNKQVIATVEERRKDLEQPLREFKIIYPKELQSREYNYQHRDEVIYAFIAIGNNRGRMHYLYDKGNFNPLPKKEVWILLKEEFELKSQDILEESTLWVWNTYKPYRVNLKKINELIIKNRETEVERKIPCKSSFSIEGTALVEDDFKEQMPLFTGNIIRIIAPRENPNGWLVRIKNKQAGYKIIPRSWTGNEPLELKVPDYLPCECGEFEVDICEQDDMISKETLFFRYIPNLKMEFPRKLIIPNSNIGHKQEIVKILLGEDVQNWELKTQEKIMHKPIDNGYQIDMPPQQDVLHFSLKKKYKSETEVNIKLTIPRLKWSTSKDEHWHDKPLQIKRDELIRGKDFFLKMCTNDLDEEYELLAILETNEKSLQKSKFTRRVTEYNLLLNKFYDTIQKNRGKITLRIEIKKKESNEMIGCLNVIHFSGIEEKPSGLLDLSKTKNMIPKVKGGRGRMRKGKGFSISEITKAGVDKSSIRRCHIPFDKRRKTEYLENIKILKRLAGGE